MDEKDIEAFADDEPSKEPGERGSGRFLAETAEIYASLAGLDLNRHNKSRGESMSIRIKQLTAAVLLSAGAASAQAQIYKVVLSGANQIPAVTSAGSGTAVISLNTTTHEMRVNASFKDLIGNTTVAHVHCCTVQPANAGVATTTPTFVGFPVGVRAGSWDNTYNMTLAGTWNVGFVTANGGTPASAEAAFVAGVAAGRSYLNVHSSTSPGGEIRGTLILHSFVPAASTRTGSLAVALNSLGAGDRRGFRQIGCPGPAGYCRTESRDGAIDAGLVFCRADDNLKYLDR